MQRVRIEQVRLMLLAQKLGPLLECLLAPVGQAPVERLTVLDARLGVDPRELLRRLDGPQEARQDA